MAAYNLKKWTNKGHEFDETGKVFSKNKKLIIACPYDEVEQIKKRLAFLNVNIEFIDDKFAKTGNCIAGKTRETLINCLGEQIVALRTLRDIRNLRLICRNMFRFLRSARLTLYYVRQLISVSFKQLFFLLYFLIYSTGKIFLISSRYTYLFNKMKTSLGDNRVFLIENFISEFSVSLSAYLSIFAVYAADKVYFSSNNLICTTICNLNCVECANFTPYNKNKKHFAIEDLKNDMDIYFSCIDMVGVLQISGGEPFLYPDLIELIEHIGEKYRNKIDDFQIVTNGTIIPSDELCEIFDKYTMRVYVDDYRKTVPKLEKTFPSVVNKLNKYKNIKPQILKHEFFMPFLMKQPMLDCSEEELAKKYDCCGNLSSTIANGKLYSCAYSKYFFTAGGGLSETENDYYDLSKFKKTKKKELVEYRLRYTNKGYVDFCRYCNGNTKMHSLKTTIAEQTDDLFEFN